MNRKPLFGNRPSLPKLVLITTVACIVTALSYGQSLTLPLFFDDLVLLPFIDRYTLFQHWTGSFESPYYRPLTMTAFKLLRLPLAGHSAVLLHGVNLLLHTINGIFAGLLGMALWERSYRPDQNTAAAAPVLLGILIAVLYILFPFHYQAVPWATALFHLIVTTLVLGALLAYLRGWVIPALVLTFLAPFAHENGIVILPTVFLIELLFSSSPAGDWRGRITRPLLFFIPVFAWLGVRLSVNTSRDGSGLFPGFESIGQSATYFIQGFVWPGTIFGRNFVGFAGLNDLAVVSIFAGLGITLAVVTIFRSNHFSQSVRLVLFSAGFWLVASAPTVLVLPFAYNVNGPRLLTVAGVGIAMFWATAIIACVDQVRSGNNRVWGAAGLLIFAVAQGLAVGHIREANRLHTFLGDAVVQAVEISENHDDEAIYPVFVNFPSSLAPAEKRFALGNEGVVFWPDYAPQHSLVTTNGLIQQSDQAFVQVDGIRQDQPYLYGIVAPTDVLEAYRPDAHAVFYNSVYSENGINLFPIGQTEPLVKQDQLGKPPLAENSFEIGMNRFEMDHVIIAGQPFVELTLAWDVRGGVGDSVTVFLHAVAEDGEIVEQVDGDPLAGLYPFSKIEKDGGIIDIRHISADPTIVFFRVGLYDRVTGERVPLFDRDGLRIDEDMMVLPVNPNQ